MTLLLTGANGFLGAAVVERLLQSGRRDFTCLVRAGSDLSRLQRLAATYPELPSHLKTGSLASVDTARTALAEHDTVLHLAAAPKGQAADIFLNTVVTAKHLLEAATSRPSRPKFVLVSSFGVYGTAELPAGTLLDESCPLEPRPAQRDVYSQAKLRQERLFREYQERHGFPLVVLRPGVIYGPTGGQLSARIGVQLPGLFLELGGHNELPLTYVDNCAEALLVAASSEAAVGQTYNVVDEDRPDCHEYFLAYQRQVEPLRSLRVPYAALLLGARWLAEYHARSGGQLPDLFTPYKVRSMWKGLTYTNAKLRALGWRQVLGTQEGMSRTFESFRRGAPASR